MNSIKGMCSHLLIAGNWTKLHSGLPQHGVGTHWDLLERAWLTSHSCGWVSI